VTVNDPKYACNHDIILLGSDHVSGVEFLCEQIMICQSIAECSEPQCYTLPLYILGNDLMYKYYHNYSN